MTSVNLISAFIGAVLSITIVFLTRRDHISPLVALRWFLIALLVLVVGFFPGAIDNIGRWLGVGYPPVIPILLGLAAALIKILLMDIERQKMAVKLDRLVQRMAILENMVEEGTVIRTNFSTENKQNQSGK